MAKNTASSADDHRAPLAPAAVPFNRKLRKILDALHEAAVEALRQGDLPWFNYLERQRATLAWGGSSNSILDDDYRRGRGDTRAGRAGSLAFRAKLADAMLRAWFLTLPSGRIPESELEARLPEIRDKVVAFLRERFAGGDWTFEPSFEVDRGDWAWQVTVHAVVVDRHVDEKAVVDAWHALVPETRLSRIYCAPVRGSDDLKHALPWSRRVERAVRYPAHELRAIRGRDADGEPRRVRLSDERRVAFLSAWFHAFGPRARQCGRFGILDSRSRFQRQAVHARLERAGRTKESGMKPLPSHQHQSLPISPRPTLKEQLIERLHRSGLLKQGFSRSKSLTQRQTCRVDERDTPGYAEAVALENLHASALST